MGEYQLDGLSIVVQPRNLFRVGILRTVQDSLAGVVKGNHAGPAHIGSGYREGFKTDALTQTSMNIFLRSLRCQA